MTVAMAYRASSSVSLRGPATAETRERTPVLSERPEVPRILLVQPDPSARALLTARLRAERLEVVPISTAAEVWHELSPARTLPDLVVMESTLPDADGTALCSSLKGELRTAHLSVLMLTSDRTARDAAIRAGAEDCLLRPLHAQDIVARVKLELDRNPLDGRCHGHTAEVPLHQALRALLGGARGGRLTLLEGKGTVVFRDGQVVSANYCALSGAPALRRMLLIAHGSYAVGFGATLAPMNVGLPLESLCDGVLEEARRWRASQGALSLDAVVAVEFRRLSERVEALDDATTRLVRLCDGRRTVMDCALESGMDELEALGILATLHAQGVIVPAEKQAERPRLLREAPRFFEPAETAPVVPEEMERMEREELVEGLSPDLALQMNAFRIRPVSDVSGLSRRLHVVEALDADDEDAPMEAASAGAPEEAVREDADDALVTPAGSSTAGKLVVAALGLALVGGGLALVVPARRTQDSAVLTTPLKLAPAPSETAPTSASFEEGVTLYRTGNAKAATVSLQRAVSEEPDNAEAWLALGFARIDSGDVRGAEKAARTSLTLAPTTAKAHLLLASVYTAQGKQEHAKVSLEQYLQLDPNGPYVGEVLQILAGLER